MRFFGLKIFAASVGAGLGSAGCGPTRAPATLPSPATRPIYPAVLVPDPSQVQQPMDDYVPGVVNFAFVSDELWRGAMPSAAGFASLKEMGVQTVIDLQEADESALVPAGIKYVPIRTSQWHADDVDTRAVLRTIAQSPKPVFIHCREGRDRTGIAVAAYRLSRGMPADDAIVELRAFHVNFWWRGMMERRIRQLAAAVPPR